MQSRLLHPKPQQIEALSGHARFRAGFDFMLLREKSADETTQGMAAWWDAYQNMSMDEKEKAISAYNRQRAKSRRKASTSAAETETTKNQSAQIEPLVKVAESRSRRTRKPREQSSNDRQGQQARTDQHSRGRPAQVDQNGIHMDHPILKRKRVQRDLSHVIFGPTQ